MLILPVTFDSVLLTRDPNLDPALFIAIVIVGRFWTDEVQQFLTDAKLT